MTKQESNDIIKRVWTEHLQRTPESIPEDLADNYSLWLRSVIQKASSMLTADGQASQEAPQQEPQGAQGGGQPPEQGAA
jgi:hypothetical protein